MSSTAVNFTTLADAVAAIPEVYEGLKGCTGLNSITAGDVGTYSRETGVQVHLTLEAFEKLLSDREGIGFREAKPLVYIYWRTASGVLVEAWSMRRDSKAAA